MNPTTLMALMGGTSLASAGLDFLGGMMNTSSQQAINAANLQQAQWSAQGGYLPGLVHNAQKAGLNPLAVLGQRGPDMAVQTGTQAGSAFSNLGRALSEAGPALEQADLARRRADAEIQASRANATLADAQTARTMQESMDIEFKNYMQRLTAARHPEWTYGLDRPPVTSEFFSKFWNNPWRLDWKLDQ